MLTYLRGVVNTFGVYQSYYTSILSQTTSRISWIGSLQACVLLIGLVLTGPLFDQGFAHSLTLVGSILVVLGMTTASISSEYWQLLLGQGLCIGLGNTCLFIVAVGNISLAFKKRRLFALGLAASGSSIGTSGPSFHSRLSEPSTGNPCSQPASYIQSYLRNYAGL